MTQYLILHKVRGEPAFDVAEQLQIGDEVGWIIPTSGHRAYPYKMWPINDLCYEDQGCIHDCELPEDWPDHYPMDAGHVPESNFNIMAVISNIMPKMKRRF